MSSRHPVSAAAVVELSSKGEGGLGPVCFEKGFALQGMQPQVWFSTQPGSLEELWVGDCLRQGPAEN